MSKIEYLRYPKCSFKTLETPLNFFIGNIISKRFFVKCLFTITIYTRFCFIPLKEVSGDLIAEGSDAKPVLDFATVPGYDNVQLHECG